MDKKKTILGICGSLRKGSYNTGLLLAAKELLPQGYQLHLASWEELPWYNQDLDQTLPPSVVSFKEQISTAHGVLISTPEYNYSIPGGLKNAIDWGSRPYGKSCWQGKKVGMIGASVGQYGTCRAQYHLRQILLGINAHTPNRPELMIGNASERFDASGRLTEQATRKRLEEFLSVFTNWLEEEK